jgi:hypothetical protein
MGRSTSKLKCVPHAPLQSDTSDSMRTYTHTLGRTRAHAHSGARKRKHASVHEQKRMQQVNEADAGGELIRQMGEKFE